jgi:hypothetical protein
MEGRDTLATEPHTQPDTRRVCTKECASRFLQHAPITKRTRQDDVRCVTQSVGHTMTNHHASSAAMQVVNFSSWVLWFNKRTQPHGCMRNHVLRVFSVNCVTLLLIEVAGHLHVHELFF